jgi:hypothetical protein
LSTDHSHPPIAGSRNESARRAGSRACSGIVLGLAELFVLPAEHRRSDLAMFEELMTSLFAGAPPCERAKATALLAGRADLPPAIAAIMASDEIEIARPILTSSPVLTTIDRIRVIGNRSEAHRQAIATRADLEDAVISALLVHGRAETIATLSANTALSLSPSQMDHLVDRVIEEGRGIETLSDTLDLGPARRIDLFFELTSDDRRRALLAFDAETAFRRIEKRGRRTPPSVQPGLQRQLIDAVFTGETAVFAGLLSEALGVDRTLGERIVRDSGGEALVVALLAAGLDPTDATSIFVRSDPAFGWTYHTIRDLVWLYERVGWRTAEAVLERWSAAGGKRLISAVRQTDGSGRHVAPDRRDTRSKGPVTDRVSAGRIAHRIG